MSTGVYGQGVNISRLLCVLMAALAKLAASCQDIVPRVRLCLTKVCCTARLRLPSSLFLVCVCVCVCVCACAGDSLFVPLTHVCWQIGSGDHCYSRL